LQPRNKFDSFLEEALKFDADFVATGHYCRKSEIEVNGETIHQLLAGKDPNKDQSYFLCQLNQQQLSKAMFPVGELLKPEVRKLHANKTCQLPNVKIHREFVLLEKLIYPHFCNSNFSQKQVISLKFRLFLWKRKNRLKFQKKTTENLCFQFPYKPWNGEVIGEHQGAHFYTIGQRKGLNIGGHKEPLFVIGTDVQRNIIYVGEGQNHPGLFRPGLFVAANEMHWIRTDLKMQPGEKRKFDIRIRYRQPLEKGTIHLKEEGAYFIFEIEQRGITSGQFAAWYTGDELIGSGGLSNRMKFKVQGLKLKVCSKK
jgi:tRNA-uridine 2-sulfurtransferase